jgi:hypothetical protein
LFLILAASYWSELKRHPQDRHRNQQFHFHRKDKPGTLSEVAAENVAGHFARDGLIRSRDVEPCSSKSRD